MFTQGVCPRQEGRYLPSHQVKTILTCQIDMLYIVNVFYYSLHYCYTLVNFVSLFIYKAAGNAA